MQGRDGSGTAAVKATMHALGQGNNNLKIKDDQSHICMHDMIHGA